jgi:hypothetical protein
VKTLSPPGPPGPPGPRPARARPAPDPRAPAGLCPLDNAHEMGRTSPGNVVFVHRGVGDAEPRPGLPGHAAARFNRLVGLDFLNRFLGAEFWKYQKQVVVRNPAGGLTTKTVYAHILVDPGRVEDDWRSVPFLSEWALDGVVLSDDQPEAYYSDSSGKRDGQLFNVAVQGPCTVNNGYIDASEQGQLARAAHEIRAQGFMDHRVEKYGPQNGKKDTQGGFDMAIDQALIGSNTKASNYHLYPLQMFSRYVRPMHELFVGIVAVTHRVGEAADYAAYDAAVEARAEAEKELLVVQNQLSLTSEQVEEKRKQVRSWRRRNVPSRAQAEAQRDAGDANAAALLRALDNLEAELEAVRFVQDAQKQLADDTRDSVSDAKLAVEALQTAELRAWLEGREVFRKAGWWDEGASTPTAEAPKKEFYSFKYILFTSADLWELDTDVEVMHDINEPVQKRARRNETKDFFDPEEKYEDLRRLVGAWRVGHVTDMKAAKMPYFEGGPIETGYRVTCNVNIEFMDWRALRKKYTPSPGAKQVGDLLLQNRFDPSDEGSQVEHARRFMWPTLYNNDEYKPVSAYDSSEAAEDAFAGYANAPINPGAAFEAFDDKASVERQFWTYPSEAARAAPDYWKWRDGGEPGADYYNTSPNLPSAGQVAQVNKAQRSAYVKQYYERLGLLKIDPDDDFAFPPDIAPLFAPFRKPPELPVVDGNAPPEQRIDAQIARYHSAATHLQARLTMSLLRNRRSIGASCHAQKRPESGSSSEAEGAPAEVLAPASTGVRPLPATVDAMLAAPLPPTGGKAPAAAAPQQRSDSAPSAGAASSSSAPEPTGAAASAPEPAEPAPEQAPRAASAAAPRRARGGMPPSTDVFSSIFGEAQSTTPMEPLNPAHRASGPSGSSGRSFPRRKGKDAS